jgi:hypothetical protein
MAFISIPQMDVGEVGWRLLHTYRTKNIRVLANMGGAGNTIIMNGYDKTIIAVPNIIANT